MSIREHINFCPAKQKSPQKPIHSLDQLASSSYNRVMGLKELFTRKRANNNEARTEIETKQPKAVQETSTGNTAEQGELPPESPSKVLNLPSPRSQHPAAKLDKPRLVTFVDKEGKRHRFYAKHNKKRKQRNTANQRAMAKALQIDPTHLCRVLSGERKPTLEQAKKMADYLGLEMGKLYEALEDVRQKNLANPKRLHPKMAIKVRDKTGLRIARVSRIEKA